MAKSKIVSAIEIGSSKMTALMAQVVQNPQTYEITSNVIGVASSESKGIKKGQIVNIEEAVEAIIDCVDATERMAGYKMENAYVSLSGASVSSQNSHGVVAVSDAEGEITTPDVDRVIEAASAVSLPSLREVVHVIPSEYIVDGEGGIKDPINMSGTRLEVETHIITASSATIKNIRKAIHDVDVKINELVFSGIAAAEAVLSPTEKELGCVLVDIGGGITSVVVYLDGSIRHSSVLPIGSKNVTADLAIGLKFDLDDAEKIKIVLSDDRADKGDNVGDVLDLTKLGITELRKVSRKTLIDGIIKPRLNEIFTYIKLDLEKAGILNKVPAGIIVCGGGALTVSVLECAKRMTGLPAKIGIPKNIGGLVDDVLTPAYAVSIGLILYGAKQEPQEVPSFASKIKFPGKGILGKLIGI